MVKASRAVGLRALLPFITALGGISGLSLGLFLVGAWRNHSLAEWYLLWNLFLGWLPLAFAAALMYVLRRRPWSSWPGIALSGLWLAFLPNSFYMVTDYIHLQDLSRVDVVFDAVTFTAFVLASLGAGFTSLALVHYQLRRRLNRVRSFGGVLAVLLLCSFAIYLGRDLRWNTWDILLNPAALLLDVSDRLIAPMAHPEAFVLTSTFFVFLSGLYISGWCLIAVVRRLGR